MFQSHEQNIKFYRLMIFYNINPLIYLHYLYLFNKFFTNS
jgi:hypothetical protein